MISALMALVFFGVPVALIVKRKDIAALRHTGRFLGITAVAWVVALGVLGGFVEQPAQVHDAAGTSSTPPPVQAPVSAQASPAPAVVEPVKPAPSVENGVLIARVIDGDTVELTDGRRVRVLGIDAPELGQPCFGEATDNLAKLIGSVPVSLTPDDSQADVDQYGRLLRYVGETNYLNGDVSEQQAQAGFARYYDVGQSVSKAAAIHRGEAAAKQRAAGMWGMPACAPAPQPTSVIPVTPDAPAEDDIDTHVYIPQTHVPAPDVDAKSKRSGGKPGCNPLTARDGDGDGIVCEK